MPSAALVENAADHFLEVMAEVNRQSMEFIFARRPEIRINLKLRPDARPGPFLFDAHSEFYHDFAPLLVPPPAFIPSPGNGKRQNHPRPPRACIDLACSGG